MSTIRTTITLRPSLLERLKIFARANNKPMSEVIQEGLTRILDQAEQRRLKTMYDGLSSLAGSSQAPIPDASGRIDAMLYGQRGAWRGDAN